MECAVQCVAHRFLKRKVVVSTQEQKLWHEKYALAHACIQLYIAEIMHGMHSGSVPTSMLAVFKLVKTLISANMYGMRSTCACTSISETESSSKHTRTKLCIKKYALAHVYITVCC